MIRFQLLNSLNEVASFCLTSILTSIFKWRDMEVRREGRKRRRERWGREGGREGEGGRERERERKKERERERDARCTVYSPTAHI